MRDLAVLFLHLLTTAARLAGPGGARSVVAESLLVKQQLPSSTVLGNGHAVFASPIRREALNALQPSSSADQAEISPAFLVRPARKAGSKGTSQEVVTAVIDMKRRNPTWGCPRIAQQITLAFGIPINNEVVRRLFAARNQPTPDSTGPSWLTTLGHATDSLWSLDLFRCESAVLRSHWVLVVMDQCTRRIVGSGVHRGDVDGVGLCRMFNRATRRQSSPISQFGPRSPVSFRRWQANLRILDIGEIKTVPYAPLSHPLVERLIGTIRRECLDRTLFWTAADLEAKLRDFQRYYDGHRAHAGLNGRPPTPSADRGCGLASSYSPSNLLLTR